MISKPKALGEHGGAEDNALFILQQRLQRAERSNTGRVLPQVSKQLMTKETNQVAADGSVQRLEDNGAYLDRVTLCVRNRVKVQQMQNMTPRRGATLADCIDELRMSGGMDSANRWLDDVRKAAR